MRPLLLDTCAILRLAHGEFRKFSRSAMAALRNADALYVSPMSEWEISLKWRDGGIELPLEPRELMRQLTEAYSLSLIPLSEEVMFRSTELPNLHRDPADRFIIATALMRSLPVVTTDRRFSQYGVTVIS